MMEGHQHNSRLPICPICKREGKQKIIEGILCYIHRKKHEKCCKWGKVVNLSELLDQKKSLKILIVVIISNSFVLRM
jgi:hypothetical protein